MRFLSCPSLVMWCFACHLPFAACHARQARRPSRDSATGSGSACERACFAARGRRDRGLCFLAGGTPFFFGCRCCFVLACFRLFCVFLFFLFFSFFSLCFFVVLRPLKKLQYFFCMYFLSYPVKWVQKMSDSDSPDTWVQ